MAYVAVSAISGMNVQVLSEGETPNSACVRLLIYGTYTAADFYLTPYDGVLFKPGKVRIVNATDGKISEWYLDDVTNLTNAGFTQVAAGDKTLVAKTAMGVSWEAGRLYFDISACANIATNDEVIVELYR
jgi:hypothetical protein